MSNLNISYSHQGKTMASQGACRSGTGVFYQAMPAVGTDGRNVMKLIPVQKVNGQFVRSPTSTMKDIAEPQRDLTLDVPSISKINMSTLGPTAKGQSVNKRPFYMSTSPNPTNLTGIYKSVSIQTPIVTTKVGQSVLSLTSPEQTLLNKEQLPVTVKSPALPNGQYLQIPPNAQVKTLPASALPPAIKRQIFTSSTSCASNSNLPMVLYVSPVQTMKPGGTPLCPTSQKAPLSLSRLPRSSGQTQSTCSSTGSTPCSTTAKDGKRPVTPIKWVIEEADGSPAPCLVPVNSSSMTSDILKTLAEMEKATKPGENIAKKCSPSQESLTKIGQEKDNALVMYNGKVYFVAKKTPELCNRPSKPLEASRNMGDSTTQAAESVGFNQRISLPPPLPLSSSFASQLSNKTRPDPKHIVIPDDIIDLCDDDPQDDLTYQAISTRDITRQPFRQSEVDEDEDSNVIFVSYLPPKTVSKVAEENKERAHMLNDLETEQEVLCSQDHLNGQVVDSQNKVSGLSIEKCQSIATAQDMAGCQGSATGQELNSRQHNITGQYRKILQRFHCRATGIRIENIQGNATSKEMGSSHPSPSTQEMGIVQDDATDQGIGNSHHHPATQEIDNITGSTSLQTEMETHNEKSSSDPIPEQRTSVLDMESLETCDRLLKQMFGITSDVKICLERIDAKPKAIPKVFPRIGTTNKRTIEAIRKLLQGSNILIKKREHKETEVSATIKDGSFPIDAKRLKIEKVENASESSKNTEHLTSPTPQLEMQPLTSPTPQLEMKPLTSPSPQLEMQPLTSPTPQLEMQPLTSPTPQLEIQPLTSPSPKLDILSDAEHIFGYEEPTVNDLISTAVETGVPSKPLPEINPGHISKSSNSPVPSVHPQRNAEAMDCAPGPFCGTPSNIKPNSKRRRGKGKRCTACPCGVTGTLVQEKAMSSSSTSQEEPSSSKPANTRSSGSSISATATSAKRKGRKSTKAQMEDKERTSVEIQCPSTVSEQGSSTAGEIPTSYLCSTALMDPEEIKRHERIKRLKELLKEKEAALAVIRKNMG